MAECLVEKRGHVLIVTMNRPEARNALSTEMMAIMEDAWDQVDDDPDIRESVDNLAAHLKSIAPEALASRERNQLADYTSELATQLRRLSDLVSERYFVRPTPLHRVSTIHEIGVRQ